MKRFRKWLTRNFDVPVLVIGLMVWPVAGYGVHLFCHAYGWLWQ